MDCQIILSIGLVIDIDCQFTSIGLDWQPCKRSMIEISARYDRDAIAAHFHSFPTKHLRCTGYEGNDFPLSHNPGVKNYSGPAPPGVSWVSGHPLLQENEALLGQ